MSEVSWGHPTCRIRNIYEENPVIAHLCRQKVGMKVGMKCAMFINMQLKLYTWISTYEVRKLRALRHVRFVSVPVQFSSSYSERTRAFLQITCFFFFFFFFSDRCGFEHNSRRMRESWSLLVNPPRDLVFHWRLGVKSIFGKTVWKYFAKPKYHDIEIINYTASTASVHFEYGISNVAIFNGQ